MGIPDWAKKLPWNVISKVASLEKVEASVLAAIAMQESSGNQYAMRYEPNYQWLCEPHKFKGAAGTTLDTEITLQKFSYSYCQVMGATARSLGFIGNFPELFDPALAFTYGARYLKRCMEKYPGKLEDAFSAYNAGSARKVDDTRYVNDQYVKGVMFYLGELK